MNEFSKRDVAIVFFSTFRDPVVLADGLIDAWFEMALGQYELEIEPLGYDREEDVFPESVTRPVLNTLAYMMKVYYCEREVSRVLKINNIITKDITLNGNGDTKRYALEDLAVAKARVEDCINKIKTSWYQN